MRSYKFSCFKCDKRFNVSTTKTKMIKFSNDYGDWQGVKCECGGMAKHIGVSLNIGSNNHALGLVKERDKHSKDLIQPFRGDNFSQEFRDTYPDQTKKMIKSKSVTKKEVQNAKRVWR